MIRQLNKFAKSQKGVTLIELVIILVIIASIVSISASTLKWGSRNYDFRVSVIEFANFIRDSRQQALRQNQELVVFVDVQNLSYWAAKTKKLKKFPDDTKLSIVSAKYKNNAALVSKIKFFPDGSTSGANILISQNNKSFEIQVDWLTGKLIIHEKE